MRRTTRAIDFENATTGSTTEYTWFEVTASDGGTPVTTMLMLRWMKASSAFYADETPRARGASRIAEGRCSPRAGKISEHAAPYGRAVCPESSRR